MILNGQHAELGEHAYQGEHAKFAKRPDIFNAILQTSHATSAKFFCKRLGKDLAWEKIKVDKMAAILRCKFTQNEALRKHMISTRPFNVIIIFILICIQF